MLLSLLLAAWPADTSGLHHLELPALPVKRVRVVIDAGHGAPGNVGNHGCHCQEEQAHTRFVADFMAAALEATGRFEVLRTRIDDATPKYAARIAQAQQWKADVIISLHSDARGEAFAARQPSGEVCWQNPDAPGFAVLWNDEGAALAGREKLGRAVGVRLREAGFVAYSGEDYGGLYRQDAVEPSGWIDQRPLKQRVYFLRASKIPTVIIETHHALDVEEAARWTQVKTLETFTAAVGAAVLDFAAK